jgi:hypothetical protein
MWDGYVSDEVDYISKLRDLKIKMLNGEKFFNIDTSSVEKNKKILDFISNTFVDDIITGSLALALFNLLNRDIGDIDILIKDPNRYSNYKLQGYGDDVITNRLGYKSFDYKHSLFSRSKNYDVDFFIDNGVNFIEFEFNKMVLKVHHPIEIISHKIEMIKKGRTTSSKHTGDLYRIFNSINFEN